MKTVICHTRGEARGNPGPAGIGIFITDEAGVVLKEISQSIGNSNRNFAEYNAVMVGLQTLTDLLGPATQTTQIEIKLDNELVKQQLNAESQIKEPGLVPMFIEIHNMRVASFPHLTLTQVLRIENTEADRLVNDVLDGIV